MKPQSIAIIGSGTSGLAAAAFLTRDGHNVTLFERFADPRPLGAGLMLQPTGLAVLACLGLDKKMLGYGAKILHIHGKSAGGRTVFDLRYNDLHPRAFGLGIHRGALFSVLYNEVLRLGVNVATGCEITATEAAGDKRLIFDKAGENRGAFDIVIDASGARSPLRGRYGALTYNKPFPYGAVWGICEDPGQGFGGNSLQQRYDGAHVMIGALAIGKRPSDMKDTLAFFWSLPANAYPAWREAALQDGMAGWKSRVLGYWPAMAPFLAQFGSADELTFAQYSDVTMKRWHGDRLGFIGDAGRCTSPQLGQGANMGLIDALVLAGCLRDEAPVNAALEKFTSLRRGHTRFYQLASRWLTPFFQSDSRCAPFLRDRTFATLAQVPYMRNEMLRTLGGVKTGVCGHLNPGDWHPDYDLRRSQPL